MKHTEAEGVAWGRPRREGCGGWVAPRCAVVMRKRPRQRAEGVTVVSVGDQKGLIRPGAAAQQVRARRLA